MDSDFDYLFKILVIGESGVGKSALLLRFAENTFSETFMSTVGVDFKIKKVNVRDKVLKLQIWDTAGQERFRTIMASFYRGAHGILLVFDVTDPGSFLKVKYWLEQIKGHAPESTVVLLVGNKSDDVQRRQVDTVEASTFSEKLGLRYVETSAKDGSGVAKAFTDLATQILDAAISGKLKLLPTTNQVTPGTAGTDQNKCAC
jgi:Ras-related protein Rab-1A